MPVGFHTESPLHDAAQRGDVAAIDDLLSGRGYVDPNAVDSRGWTPLHYASAERHAAAERRLAATLTGRPSSLAAAVRRLVTKFTGRPSPLTLDLPTTSSNETPLVLAIETRSTEMVQGLLEAGADVTPGVLFRDGWKRQ